MGGFNSTGRQMAGDDRKPVTLLDFPACFRTHIFDRLSLSKINGNFARPKLPLLNIKGKLRRISVVQIRNK